MADFPFLSDSDEDKAVDELLSQTMDQHVLEQIAAINSSGFTDSALPTHLEARFQKLKSFPSANPKPKPSTHSQRHCAPSSSVFKRSNEDESVSKSNFLAENDVKNDGLELDLENNSVDEVGLNGNSESRFGSNPSKSLRFSGKDKIFSDSEKNPFGEKDLEGKSYSGLPSEPSYSIEFSAEDEDFSSLKKKPTVKKKRELKSPSVSSSFPSDSSLESSSPPQKGGCFWCSPKKGPKKTNKENRVLDVGFDWDKNNGYLSDLNSFSGKSQQKWLKKAMEEEEKISREAEKIVKWAKQASARMEVSCIEDELSDNESLKRYQ